MPLPKIYRFLLYNDTGVTIPFTSTSGTNTFAMVGEGWKDTASGLVYQAGLIDAFQTQPLGNLHGVDFRAVLVTDANVNGNLRIYMEFSEDGVNFPSSSPDFQIQADSDLRKILNTATGNPDRAVNVRIQ